MVVASDDSDALTFDWSVLRYEHTSALRALLVAHELAPSTANRHLAALRGVPRECWRLGYRPVDVEDYHRAVDLEPIRGSRLPRGRALEAGEIDRLLARPSMRWSFGSTSCCVVGRRTSVTKLHQS